MEYVAIQCVGAADVRINPNRSLVLARDLDDVRERLFF
jgi:hypothetical protein